MSRNIQIFITGIDGFVGQNLKPYLANDFKTIDISRKKIKSTTSH